MRYGSVCSGVEAASLAWGKLGWKPVFFSEVDPFPCEVLAARFDAPNLGDMTKIEVRDDGTITNGLHDAEGGIDLLVGGTPCQDVSVAGKRAGLIEGQRSSLAFNYVRLAYDTRARWLVWENVPGVLSSGNGRDFAAFLSSLARWDVPVPSGGWKNSGIIQNNRGGYGLAYRVLDAQYTRVAGFPRAIPQRRRRVFLVGYRSQPNGGAMDWTHSAAVLFDGESLHGNPPSRRTAGKETSRDTAEGTDGTGREDGVFGKDAEAGQAETGMRHGDQTDGHRGGNEPECTADGIHGHKGNGESGTGKEGRPWDESGVNPTLNQSAKGSGGIGASDQEIFSQNANGLVMQKIYTLDADRSNSMKSANPNSGIHEAKVANCLDTTTPSPQKAQGGQMILENPPPPEQR